MEKWEYATLGWYTDHTNLKPVFYWRRGEEEMQRIDPDSFAAALAKAGQAGWELVTSTAIPKTAETLYFKRRSSEV